MKGTKLNAKAEDEDRDISALVMTRRTDLLAGRHQGWEPHVE